MAAVQDQVIQNYETFYDIYAAEKRSNGKLVSKKGKGRDDEAWDPDMFTEWAAGVFRVRGMGALDDDDDDDGGGSRSRSRSLSRSGSM